MLKRNFGREEDYVYMVEERDEFGGVGEERGRVLSITQLVKVLLLTFIKGQDRLNKSHEE